VPRENEVLQFIVITGNYSQSGMISMRQKGITKVCWLQVFLLKTAEMGGVRRDITIAMGITLAMTFGERLPV
jgi:hypothetical protein